MAETRMQPNAAERVPRDLSGTTVGRFVVQARLGQGGMGEVYRADDVGLKRPVALKRISGTLRADERSRKRLWKEAQLASQLTDPHIAAVHDVLEEGDELFVVMEYVEGETLRHRLDQPLPIREFFSVATQCIAGVVTAHRAGILHGDIKPENIMLTPAGRVKILDFGVAQRFVGSGSTTTLETLTDKNPGGTVAYTAPEVLEGKERDARADIFSLGVVFYEALGGRNPFHADGFLPTCERILREEPAPLREVNSQIPEELDRIVAKMLAKDPGQRYSSASDLRVDFLALRRAVRFRRAPNFRKRIARRPWLLAGVVLAATTCVSLASWLAYRRFRAPVLTQHATVLLADFENLTGEKLFDKTVTEAMREALTQSRYVRLVPQSQVLEASERMERKNVAHVDAALGLEIARRENYRALLTGQIAPAGGAYLLTVHVMDPQKGEPLLTQAATLRSPSELYTAVDSLAKRLRKRLGESLTQVNQESQPLAKVTTPSLDALQRYSRAMEFYAAADYDNFLPLAKSATDLDPGFAMAHLALAYVFSWRGDEVSARQEMEQARLHLDRVTERERYLILATGYEFQGLYEKAAEQYRLLTEVYSDDLEGYRGLAETSVWSGHTEEGVAAEKHALELNPNSPSDYRPLIFYLVRLNRFSKALTEFQAAQARQIRSPRLYLGAGLAYLGQGDTQPAREEFELLGKEGGPYEQSLSALYTAKVLMYEGRLREAAEALRPGLILGEKLHSESWIPGQRYLLGQVLWTLRRVPESRAEMRRVVAEASAQLLEQELRHGGLMALQMGDLPTARKLQSRLKELSDQRDSGFTRSCYYNLKGAVDLASGDTTSAIENQRRAALFFPSFEAQAGLGTAYAARKEWRSAAESYQRYLEFKGEIFDDDSPAEWVLAHLALARVLAKAGETKQALESYDGFLRLWAHADPDLRAVQEARAERDHLAGTLAAPAGSSNTVSPQR